MEQEHDLHQADELIPLLPDLISSWKSEFDLGFLLLQSFDCAPGDFRTSSYMSLLFSQLGKKESIKNLVDWLEKHISPFYMTLPRDEADLEDKTLGIAAYILASDLGEAETLSSDLLIDYIEFAERQLWFNDSYLAFFCHFLKDKVQVCANVDAYFKENIERFLASKNLAVICQTYIVLSKNLSTQDSEKILNQIISLIPQDLHQVPFVNLGWGIWALSIANRTSDNKNVNMLGEEISLRIRETSAYLVKTFKPIGLMALVKSDATEDAIHEYLGEDEQGADFQYEYDLTNRRFAFYVYEQPPTGDAHEYTFNSNYLDINSLTVGILSLAMAKRHTITGVSGSEEEVISSLYSWSGKKKQGAKLIPRSGVIIGNILAFCLTLMVGLFYILYMLGFGFELNAPQTLQRPGLGDLFILVTWGDFVFSLLKSMKNGDSVFESMKSISIIRQFIGRWKH